MKKINYIVCFLFLLFVAFSNPVIIGIAEPYIFNKTNGTLFIQNNIIFELLTLLKSDQFEFSSISTSASSLNNYRINNIQYAISNNFDYLLLIETYSISNKIFMHIKLIDPYTNQNIFIKNFNIEFDIKVNEAIGIISSNIIYELSNLTLKIKQKKNIVDVNKEEKKDIKNNDIISDLLIMLNNYPKNEIFFMNGFFKNNSEVFSLFNLYTGYSRYISDGFFFDVGFFGGFGTISNEFSFESSYFNDAFVGMFSGLHFYIKGIIEPNLGARLELTYTSRNNVSLSIPIDLGIKFFIYKKNIIRINTSFPLNSYDILNNKWEKKISLGIMVGYGFKI
ncbi:MAG: hypothetical protein A2015_16340 [Spirochaetes bacterium GWF1_31_7]|nr:MAG: hypothetical protein A2Y30_13705 [Spirochaetes bacterium GWE1_32_154]OHD50018.1 MAG: hypothetical protein A2Y29_11750 [Spirochaetes bacterium GWE2_31_10]OHD52332.1 MAG: hypothetical protein A2015_16340 [Spirochaetes bacterium GWF1_31_7]HBI38483.1 hypothetical protein [Spirochaetia bacterium]